MIAPDPIARILSDLSAAGYQACRASELQPDATTGFSSGECLSEGQFDMANEVDVTSEKEWEDACERMVGELEATSAEAKALATEVCGENHTQKQFGLAYEVVKQRARLQEAEAALKEAAE